MLPVLLPNLIESFQEAKEFYDNQCLGLKRKFNQLRKGEDSEESGYSDNNVNEEERGESEQGDEENYGDGEEGDEQSDDVDSDEEGEERGNDEDGDEKGEQEYVGEQNANDEDEVVKEGEKSEKMKGLKPRMIKFKRCDCKQHGEIDKKGGK